jgi:hypothetical protein
MGRRTYEKHFQNNAKHINASTEEYIVELTEQNLLLLRDVLVE